MKTHSESNVPQKVKIQLPCEGGDRVISIDGVPIHNVCGVGIQTEGDDVNFCIITLKIRVAAQGLLFEAEQVDPTRAPILLG